MAQVQTGVTNTSNRHRFQHELDDFQIGFKTGMTVDLGADLQQLAAGQQVRRTGVQHVAAIAQAGHAGAVQQVRINARDLRSHVGPYTQSAPRQLINQLASAQIQIATGARQQ
ncbi:hypothetical protein D3C78_1343380 [compost metagenome]